MFAEEYRVFSENVAFATRTLHTYLHIQKKVENSKQARDALNANVRFWNDYNYIAPQTVIIFLGKIFDPDDGTHSIHKFLTALEDSLSHFDKASIKSRKPPFAGIDEYMTTVHELSLADIRRMQRKLRKAKKLWGGIKPLRDKVYAHNDASLTREDVGNLFKNTLIQDLVMITRILANVRNLVWQAEHNGRKPDLRLSFRGTRKDGIESAKSVLKLLIAGQRALTNEKKNALLKRKRRKN